MVIVILLHSDIKVSYDTKHYVIFVHIRVSSDTEHYDLRTLFALLFDAAHIWLYRDLIISGTNKRRDSSQVIG